MDLSWNYAAEAQAYDRCHRIGQEKEVFVKRLVVEDTIEDRYVFLRVLLMRLPDPRSKQHVTSAGCQDRLVFAVIIVLEILG